ncbi:MAG: iron ABC transporter permease [Steroidobacteraceae bacterium]
MKTPETARMIFGSALLVAALMAVAVAALGIGQVQLSLPQTVAALFSDSADAVQAQIVNQIRMPRVLTAAFAGAALGIAGVLMQALFRNPVADAWSLGLTAGGQLGVAMTVAGAAFVGPSALGFLESFQGISLTAGAAVGVAAAAAAMLVLGRRLGTVTLLVVGLMIWFTAQGLVSVIMHFASRAGGRVFSGWNDGNFAGVTPANLPLMVVPILLGAAVALLAAKPLTSLLLGESYAKSLGTDVPRLRLQTLASTVLLVAPVTAFCGPVTFIGLIVPHVARAIAGSARIAPLIPLAALAGALLAVAADFVVHLPWEQHFLHLNAVLALVGAPVVILLLIFSPTMRGYR